MLSCKTSSNERLIGQIAQRLLQHHKQKCFLSSESTLLESLRGQAAKLLHLDSSTSIDLNHKLSVIHIGKSSQLFTPDIDISKFPNSSFVSRIHANIYKEENAYFIEDMGSRNGTYLNSQLLLPKTRYTLKTGDRISLTKKDLLTFVFLSV